MSYFLWEPKVKSLIMKKPLVLVKHSPSVARPSARRGQAVDREDPATPTLLIHS